MEIRAGEEAQAFGYRMEIHGRLGPASLRLQRSRVLIFLLLHIRKMLASRLKAA